MAVLETAIMIKQGMTRPAAVKEENPSTWRNTSGMVNNLKETCTLWTNTHWEDTASPNS